MQHVNDEKRRVVTLAPAAAPPKPTDMATLCAGANKFGEDVDALVRAFMEEHPTAPVAMLVGVLHIVAHALIASIPDRDDAPSDT